MFKVVSVSLNNSCQNALVKTLSRSEIITDGIPCSLYILARNAWAIVIAVYGCARQMKCAYLVSLSITTRIVSKVLDLGRPSIKSRLMVCQAN